MGAIFERRLAWGFGLALAVLSANALVSYHDLADLSANTALVVRSRSVLEGVEDFISALKDAEAARRGYLVDSNPADLANFEKAADTVIDEVATLGQLTSDRADQHDRCHGLDHEARDLIDELRDSIARARVDGPPRRAGPLQPRPDPRPALSGPRPRPGDRGRREQADEAEGRRAPGEHLAGLRHVLDRLDPDPRPDRRPLCPGPTPPRHAAVVGADPPRERGAGPAPAQLGGRGGLWRRHRRPLHVLQSRRPRPPRLLLGRRGARPEHARADPSHPGRRLLLPRDGLPDLPDLPERPGDPRRGGLLLPGRRLADPGRVPRPPDPPRRRVDRCRRHLRRHRPEAPSRGRDAAPRPGAPGDHPGDLHHRPGPVGRADHLRQRRLRAPHRLTPRTRWPAGTSSSSAAPGPTPAPSPG